MELYKAGLLAWPRWQCSANLEEHECPILKGQETGHGDEAGCLVLQCREHRWQSLARPCVLLPAVLRVILPHVFDEVGFLQAFVSW